MLCNREEFQCSFGDFEAELCWFILGVVRDLFLSRMLRRISKVEQNTTRPARDLVDVALMYFLALNF